MHNIFSRARFSVISGNNVEKDYIEIPSLVFEKICWDPNVMKKLSSHIDNGSKITDALIKKLVKTRNLNIGINYRKNIFFALYDQLVHSSDKFYSLCEKLLISDTDDTGLVDTMVGVYTQSFNKTFSFDDVNKKYTLEIMDRIYPPSFTPTLINGNECMNYNSILSEVYAADIYYEKFFDAPLSKKNATEFMTLMMNPGGGMPGLKQISNYLGRKPNVDNFLKYNNILSDDSERSSMFFKSSEQNEGSRSQTTRKESDSDESTVVENGYNSSDNGFGVIEVDRQTEDAADSYYITENTETLSKYKSIFTK